MPDSALLQRTELPRPDVSLTDAQTILGDFYDLHGDIHELGSQQDRNFLIDTGAERFVLKVTRAEYPHAELEAQNLAMIHLRSLDLGLDIPEPVVALTGEYIPEYEIAGSRYWLRVLTFLEGQPLTKQKFLAPEQVAALGDVTARIALGLRDFNHP
eukprot:gene47517-biopygen38517